MGRRNYTLGEAILVGGRMGAVEQVIYKWKQYQAVGTNTYYWNRYNVVSTTTYKWNKWNRLDTTTYTWNKYHITNGWIEEAYGELTSIVLDIDTAYSSFTIDKNAGRYKGAGSEYHISNGGNYSSALSNAKGAIGYYSLLSQWTVRCYITALNSISEHSTFGWQKDYAVTSYHLVEGPIKGLSAGTVSSTSSSAYPMNGVQGGYWYDGRTSSVSYSKGNTSYGQVTSSSSSAYPSNGYSGSYWYESAGSDTTYSKGSTPYPDVTSTNRSAYPDNNYSGEYWYVYSTYTTTWSQGDYIGDRLSTDRDRWPDNGRDGDYWYVFDGEA